MFIDRNNFDVRIMYCFRFSEVSSRNLIDVVALRPSSSSCGGRNVTASRVMLMRLDPFCGHVRHMAVLGASKPVWAELVVLADAFSSRTGPARARLGLVE
jgi:hypothetical protein